MTGFEFVFSLFGLLLGLALAAGLGGLARALKVRHRVSIGWPTALLGVFVSCDVVTFWMYGWAMREVIPISWPALFAGFVITGLYYVAASLVFPDDPEDWGDLSAYFDMHRRTVLGAIFLCNTALMAALGVLAGLPALTPHSLVVTWSFFPAAAIAIAASDRRVVLVCLGWLILLYPLSVLWRA
ncbi:hypothetical protein [Terricaulis sp.]|uniref:hypothetical protein n=1 Tax=Terricaulis sp. TaxID=2768686 RepID=UPI00378310A6